MSLVLLLDDDGEAPPAVAPLHNFVTRVRVLPECARETRVVVIGPQVTRVRVLNG